MHEMKKDESKMKNTYEKEKQAFVNCVKDNYDSIINLLMIENKSLDNMAFRYCVLNLKNSYQELNTLGSIHFDELVEHADFFNQLVKQSEMLSQCAGQFLDGKMDFQDFMKECQEYIKNSSDWVVFYSLYLK